MADGTPIEWTDATANFLNGCSRISRGCGGPGPHGGCYAERLAGTRLRNHPSRVGLTRQTSAGPRWTGEVRPHWPALTEVLGWTRSRMIFWNAHGDLFHANVSDELIDAVIAAAALTPQHVHQLLTKRSDRMREYFHGLDREKGIGRVARFAKAMNLIAEQTGHPSCRPGKGVPFVPHPLPNLWTGVSAEDQDCWDERVADLRQINAAVRWVSCEPLLGPIRDPGDMAGIDWIVAGGESGPRSRPMHPDWARSLRDQCAGADVPFLFKQWGDWLPWEPGCPPEWQSQSGRREDHHALFPGDIDADPNWDDGIWAVPEHEHFAFQRAGKKTAGRLLDGVEHNAMPEPRS